MPGHDHDDDHRRDRYEQLAALVWAPVQRYVRRRADPSDVDDVVAETLLVLWRRVDDVPLGAELPWAYQAARRCLANHRRGDRRRRGLTERLQGRRLEVVAPEEPGGDGPDGPLAHAMARLSSDDRELLHLWAWEQLEPREIAVVLDAAPNTVSVRLGRARRRLEAVLGAPGSPDEAMSARCHDVPDAGHSWGVDPMEQRP